MRYPPKSQAPEFLDTREHDPGEFEGLLEAVRRTNRRYGGYALVLGYLERFIPAIPHRPITILDVATASADVPAAIARWARAHGLAVRIAALDIHPDIVRSARRITAGTGVMLLRGDAFALPFADRGVDIVVNALALHHFAFDDAVRILREITRVARAGFIVNDVLRSWSAYLGAIADTWVIGRNRLARHDGPVSVLRSFTWPEFHDLARAAGLDGVEIRRHRVQRAVIVRWPEGLRRGR
ncbi:MAG: methyltransferase domain-containing protein [Armatimonadota bacterium]|nr:methyltransferase domain-containing protein [Armatimonadota bacterium]